MVFNEIAMRSLFLTFITRVTKKYPLATYNFCVMGNHVHFAVRPDADSSLSKIMQWLLGNYAKAWNKEHCVRGHLWGDRFFSRIIRGDREFLRVFEYISRNPVEAGLAGSAEEWEYGGVWHFLKGETSILDSPPLIKAVYQAFSRWQN
jgi:putative transposase